MKMNETIKARRKELNLTQEQVASYLGVTSPAVHKWEKGTSFPDVSLLPALARLLNMDLNTLFSFETELSEQEINCLLRDAMDLMEAEGFRKGYETILCKIREFSTCGQLAYAAAVFLDGALMLYAREETDFYENEIEALYERAVKYGDEEIKHLSNHMLIVKYMKRKEYARAEKLWETLPETSIDKKGMKATLYMNQGKYEEAVSILEEKLYQTVNSTLGSLSMLLDCFWHLERETEASFCVKKIHEVVDGFGFWEYQKYTTDFQTAVYKKDKEKVLTSLSAMFQAMEQPFDQTKFPLYSDMKVKEKMEEGHWHDVMARMRSTLIECAKKEYGLDGEGFMQGDKDLAALLDEFEEKAPFTTYLQAGDEL